MSPALYLAVSNYTILCNHDQYLSTRKSLRFAPTTADRLQHLCTAAAHRPTEVWRSVCRTGVGPRSEGGNRLGDSGVNRWFRRGAGQGETTRYSTSITSDDADILAAPAAPLGSPGCAQPGGSTGCESGARCARAEGL